MELDRQAIERRDFPIARRGYDPASVDAHLRALAGEVEELRRQAGGAGRDSLAAAAGAQVRGILEAAQASAQAIESEAAERAARLRQETDAAAQATREQAVATARERVAAVTQATDALLQRVGSMDGEIRTLVESLRGGAGRMVGDLEALSAEMAGLYDAAAGRSHGDAAATEPEVDSEPASVLAPPPAATVPPLTSELPLPVPPAQGPPAAVPAPDAVPPFANGSSPGEDVAQPELEPDSEPFGQPVASTEGEDDLDGARLVALNMALNGDSREATGRYLAENFAVPDPERLLDEVYAAIEA